ncbi:MAG: glycosyltransferase, partial [Candidatus Aminicenantes bacterium]|nr:glycosyltransferase [Candidatus Aminicenantes bacterium]
GLAVLPVRIRGEIDLGAALRLSWAMKRRGCRLVHFHDAHAVSVGQVAARRAKVPLRFISRRVDFPLKDNALSHRKYTRDVDAIIAISEGVRQVLLDSGIPAPLIHVVPSGIDFSPFREKWPRDFLRREFSFAPDDFLVGIVAALEDHKGHTYLIQASKILKAQAPKIKIVVVGKGSLRIELNRQVHDLGVEDIVYFLGFREDVPRILASFDLFVLSSHLEGMGSSLLDAMASRLPIVATRTGGIPEVVIDGETGLLVPPRDPAALAQAILTLYHDREMAGRLAERGFEVVHEKFSAEAMAWRVIDLYEQFAHRKGIRLKEGGPA